MVRTKLQEWNVHHPTKDYKQFRTSLPKALIDALNGKKDDLLDWTVMDGKLVAELIRK